MADVVRMPPLPEPGAPVTEQELAKVMIGKPTRLTGPIVIHDCDPRTHPEDRDRYAAEKRAVAALPLDFMAQYADLKTGVIVDILRRAGLGGT
ncbi:hypothetical protein QEZ54_22120 [Catellatospora sp. KI3]|uniref:hypothetical protein n=1 Tax=Catellatospora sp. KI3 TaxID=3041620 RepID=UPI0024823932|nr:hypothetical protein [Catellatospora sp. KI3]MDI1463683.1 hypothetical protein [Catellatospora sp. KI3]